MSNRNDKVIFPPSSVAKEICHLARLGCVSANQLTHFIIATKILDPLDAPTDREGHIFAEENSRTHTAFESLIVGKGITRKLDCGGENGLCYVCPGDKILSFEKAAAEASAEMMWGILPVEKLILSFRVPQDAIYIVTFLGLRSFPTYNDAQLVAAGGGDYRSNDWDIDGTVKCFFEVNGEKIYAENSNDTSFINSPYFQIFNGGDLIEFSVIRPGVSIPAAMEIHLATHGYLAPVENYNKFQRVQTRVETAYT